MLEVRKETGLWMPSSLHKARKPGCSTRVPRRTVRLSAPTPRSIGTIETALANIQRKRIAFCQSNGVDPCETTFEKDWVSASLDGTSTDSGSSRGCSTYRITVVTAGTGSTATSQVGN